MCVITNRNSVSISNFGGDFRWQSEYPWCIIEVKRKHFPTVLKQIKKTKKKVTEKREFLRKTSFRSNRLFYMTIYYIYITGGGQLGHRQILLACGSRNAVWHPLKGCA
ncbi:Uncharacterized protein FWK35_00008292 [Aphis craccivora]|uniref:Uncharacterized protein n=1 Tax=Aphis craccivora TaxID=307492 RepID=A0A6G0YWI3_APHCR|nr:Uncharacterized protein FWK35_00008292 [Aphis craccivora]